MSDRLTYLTVPALPIGEVLLRSYAAFADRIAVMDAYRSLTYRQLHQRACAVAQGLHKLGSVPGDRVVLISPNRTEWVEVDHACHLGGFIRVALLPRLHPRELAHIVTDADPQVIIADSGWLGDTGTEWVPRAVKHVISVGEPMPGTRSLEEVVTSGEGVTLPKLEPRRNVWIMYTSGSTGLPKGVLCSGHGIGAMVRNILAELPDLGPGDTVAHTAPLSHFSGALSQAVYAAGGTNVLYPSFDVDQIALALQQGAVRILPLVPTQINMLTDEFLRLRQAGYPVDTSSLRGIVYAGSAIAPDRLARAQDLFGHIMTQFYGSSEAPMPLTALPPEEHRADVLSPGGLPRLASAGRPSAYAEVRIVDRAGAPAPVGTAGEIQSRGEHVMVGYWRQPEDTAEVVNASGWVATGDIGYFDPSGYLYIVDRKKDMIVSGGFNVFPREVENVLSTLADVREAAVVGAPSDRWGEEITAVIALQPGARLTAEDVTAHCRRSIAGYKIPKQVHFVDELPKSSAGKIQKQLVREQLWAGHHRRVQ